MIEFEDEITGSCSQCGLPLDDNFGKAIGVEGSDAAFCSVVCLEAWAQKRIQDAVSDAALAFWEVLAGRFPEATYGDLSPDAVIAFEQAATKAATAWVKTNTQLLND